MARIDRIAEVYDGTLRDAESTRVARDRIAWMVAAIGRGPVLDLGCSQGPASILAARHGFEVVGLDCVRSSLRHAAARLADESEDVRKRVRFEEGRAERLPFEEAAFSAVLFGEALEHLEAPEQVLDEVHRVLAPDGHLVLTVPFGFLYHPDHRRDVVPTMLFDLLSPRFRIEQLDQADGYLRCKAKRLAEGEDGSLDPGIVERALRYAEASLVEAQRNHFFERRLTARLQSAVDSARSRLAKLTHISSRQRERLAELEPFAFARDTAATRLAYAEHRLRRAGRSVQKNLIDGDMERRKSTLRRWLSRTRSTSAAAGYATQLNAFLERAGYADTDHFVVIYSGTREIEGHRVNRPGQLAREFVRRGIPVLFSFYRSADSDAVPDSEHPLLFQSPIGMTQRFVDRISKQIAHKATKTFIVSFPHPSVFPFVNRLHAHGWRVIYDCRDDWEAFARVGMAKWYNRTLEAWLVNNVARTFCVSSPLVQKMRSFAFDRPVELSPNAWDPHTLHIEDRTEAGVHGCVVGYFGHLTERWFDYELVRIVAQRRPDWRIELIGFGAPTDLDLPDNVFLPEAVPPSRLPDATRHWSAAMIPFKTGPLTRAADPIKVYDYLALGLPTVARIMAGIADYPYVTCEDDSDRFVSALDAAVRTKVEPSVVASFLNSNRWADRASRMLQSATEDLPDPLGVLAG